MLWLRLRVESRTRCQPVRAQRVDRPGRVLPGQHYAIAQTPDGHLWLGTEFGLFRFDGVRSAPWQPPARHARRHSLDWYFCRPCNLERRQTNPAPGAWSGICGIAVRGPSRNGVGQHPGRQAGFRPALRNSKHGTQCYGEDGAFGRAVWALYEDSSGDLWAAAQSGLWRLKPGPSRRFPTPIELIGLRKADDGRLLVAMHGAGLRQLAGDKVERYRFQAQSIRRVCSGTAKSMRIDCFGTVMEVSGSAQWS